MLLLGRSKIVLLSHVAGHSVALRGPALILALETTRKLTLDVSTYEGLFQHYRSHMNQIEAGDVSSTHALEWYASQQANPVTLDREWIAHARRDAEHISDKLEVELRGYTTNLIKESIRVSCHTPRPSAGGEWRVASDLVGKAQPGFELTFGSLWLRWATAIWPSTSRGWETCLELFDA